MAEATSASTTKPKSDTVSIFPYFFFNNLILKKINKKERKKERRAILLGHHGGGRGHPHFGQGVGSTTPLAGLGGVVQPPYDAYKKKLMGFGPRPPSPP